jgi:hypothetical protein
MSGKQDGDEEDGKSCNDRRLRWILTLLIITIIWENIRGFFHLKGVWNSATIADIGNVGSLITGIATAALVVVTIRPTKKQETETQKPESIRPGAVNTEILDILKDNAFSVVLIQIEARIAAGNFNYADFTNWKKKVARLASMMQTLLERTVSYSDQRLPCESDAEEAANNEPVRPPDIINDLSDMDLLGLGPGRHVRPEPDAFPHRSEGVPRQREANEKGSDEGHEQMRE